MLIDQDLLLEHWLLGMDKVSYASESCIGFVGKGLFFFPFFLSDWRLWWFCFGLGVEESLPQAVSELLRLQLGGGWLFTMGSSSDGISHPQQEANF